MNRVRKRPRGRRRSISARPCVGLHQRLRIRCAARDQRPAPGSTARTAASGTPGTAARRRPPAAGAAAARRRTRTAARRRAPCPAASGEHDQRNADPAAAVHHVEEERVERGQREERARHAHQRRAGDDRAAMRTALTFSPCPSAARGFSPTIRTASPAGVRYSSHASAGTQQRARAASAASACDSTGNRQPRHLRERLDRRRRRHLREADAIREVRRRSSRTA